MTGHETTIWQVSKIWHVISVKNSLCGLDEVGQLLYEVGQQTFAEHVRSYAMFGLQFSLPAHINFFDDKPEIKLLWP